MKQYFEGYYLKHQKDDITLCLIVGRTNTEKFIQVITNDFSLQLPFAKGNSFSKKGVILNIHTPQLSLTGNIRYHSLSPIRYDIMGFFKFFKMECSHGIISMSHRLEGSVVLNGEAIDFTDGKGYIEKDSGYSFPSSYIWIHANDFDEPCSVMAAIAAIPFCRLHFRGCICIIHYRGHEYRLATYLGVRILACSKDRIVLKQGKYRLEIEIKAHHGHLLAAPRNGKMTRTIREAASCPARFSFYEKGRVVFRLESRYASFEEEG